jgi:hypothetical protein
MEYKAMMGKKLNLRNPQTFNEKIQWLKLHDRKPIYTTMVDKYAAKEYVANIIGEQYIIPTLGVWDNPDDIDFNALPDQFVLKVTHDSGGLVICRDKSTLNVEEAKKKLRNSLNMNYYKVHREWPYRDVPKRIIAEQYMEDSDTSELRDYKFFSFDGVVKALFIASDRQDPTTDTKFDFFDADFRHLPFTNGHPNADSIPARPECFEEMKTLAEKLSKGIPHLRVDFYEVNGKVYFGELTFTHWSGLVPFDPESWDKQFGDWIKIPDSYGGGYWVTGN